MKNLFDKGQDIEKPIFGIGWYKESQWALLLKYAVDKDDLEPTYAAWLEGISEGIENLIKSGIQCEKIPVDVKEIIKWCEENEYPFDGESRSVYISLKTKGKFS